jgi:E3 ubiquitin-protein ligase UBR7
LKDWFHESCLNLRDRPTDSTPVEDSHVETQQAGTAESDENDDVASNSSSDGLPRPLITSSDYESFVCGSCVLRIVTLRRWAGTENIMMIVRDSPSTPWKILGGSSVTEAFNIDDAALSATEAQAPGLAAAGSKRPPTSSSSNAPDAKRPRLSPGPSALCSAPPPNAVAQKILNLSSSPECDTSLGAGDIFLKDEWREVWCHCSSVSSWSTLIWFL